MSSDAHTFLFMDLVGFTVLTAEQGDDNAAEVALSLYAHVRRLLPEHRGEEIKTIGDAMMIRCEDPLQAVELGLRICEQISDQPEFPPVRVARQGVPRIPPGIQIPASISSLPRRWAALDAGSCSAQVQRNSTTAVWNPARRGASMDGMNMPCEKLPAVARPHAEGR